MRGRFLHWPGRTGSDGSPSPSDVETPGDPRLDDEAFDAPGGTGGGDAVDQIIDAAIDRAIERLPAPFRDQLGSVAIVVEDEPTPDQLASVGVAGLFGLYQGVPRTRFEAAAASVPSKITLFRGTLLLHHPDPVALGRAVEDTLLHELAHHFGISDDRLQELHGPR